MQVAFPAVEITGFGCVSPLGIGLRQTTENLRHSRDGITPVRLFRVSKCHSKTAGQVEESLPATAASITPRSRRWTRAAQMILAALAEALAARPGFVPDCIVMGTTSGEMLLGEEFYRALASGSPAWSAARRVRAYVPHEPVMQAMSVFHFDSPIRIVSNACASGTSALGLACQIIRTGTARRVLAGGYDALSELVFAGFDCLRASTADKCRPFDVDRTGLALGEGAAIFCLEKGDSGLCITGYGSSSDTHHLTQPHPSGCGPLSAMRRALETAGAEPASVDYINAHGTGTPLNDSSEARAILELCPNAPVSSTKGMMGHALGAAGAIEAAFCCIALREGFLPANINFARSEFPLDIVANEIRKVEAQRVISNSFGFGGANAAVLLEKRP
ncbi:MAG TPA: beta-ketoacyl-[acyl-carrier-protein] synthase family protein [Terrimicrobiaceae bacterium]